MVYDLLMKAAAETTLAIAANPRRLGARIGITAVLHTWGSTLTHHPHVHMIVPGGGLSLDGSRWVACPSNFLVHVNLLARLFSGKMLAMLTDAHDAGQLTFFNAHAGLADKTDVQALHRPATAHQVPSRWGCRHPHPSQTRTCRIPASGSSRESFARVGVEDAVRDLPVEKRTEVMMSPPSSSPVRLSVVVSWTGSRSPRSPPVFPGNGSHPMAPPFPRAGPGEPSSPRSAVL